MDRQARAMMSQHSAIQHSVVLVGVQHKSMATQCGCVVAALVKHIVPLLMWGLNLFLPACLPGCVHCLSAAGADGGGW